MLSISCKLFGYPIIVEDEKTVSMPTGKVGAIFYYILLKKTVSRDELANMFWSDVGDKNAKISLRNALHKIKKIFKEDVILTPNKSILVLNENINFEIDVKKFEKNPGDNLDLYTEDFLKGFYIKNAIDFECWSSEQSSFYRELFIKNSENKIVEKFESEKYKESRNIINKILAVDNFNEISHLYLMKIYKVDSRYDKMINEYHNLKKLLNEELGIEPPKDIEILYKEALNFVKKIENNKTKEKNLEFYSRTFEFEKIEKNIEEFLKEKSSKSILITGETGVGKSILKNKIIEKNIKKFKFFEISCYSIEKNFSFLPWMKIIKMMEKDFKKSNLERPPLWEKILKNLFFDSIKNIQPSVDIFENKDDFIPNMICNSIYEAFNILGKEKKIIIIFEDIQWMDQLSMKLLINLILRTNSNVLFIGTKSDETEERTDKLLFTLNELDKLSIINLKPFDKTEVSIILNKTFGKKVSEKEVEEIFMKSKGNAFFLKEYIELFKKGEKNKIVSSKMNNILKDKFLNLSEKELDILRLISVFYGEVTLDILLKILDMKAFELLKSLENLRKLNILLEKKQGHKVLIEFSYSAYKNFIYSELSSSSKQIINKEITKVLEKEISNNVRDITLYNKLKYHYQEANQEIEALKYDVYILNYYLGFKHEIYPNLNEYNLTKGIELFVTNEKVLNRITEIKRKLILIKNSERNKNNIENIRKIEVLFMYCEGRYLIRSGRYSEGLKTINKVITLSKELKDTNIELKGYKQIIIYGIQVNNTNLMFKNIIKGIKLTKKIENMAERGIFYRLYGVYNMMIGDFKTAESLFKKSISLFLKLEETEIANSISVAANYNYIGEIRKAERKYEDALKYFEKALELSEKREVACLSIFYINIAKIYYLTNDLEFMKKYLLLSKEIVKKFELYWRAPVLHSFLALLSFMEEDYSKTVKYLKDAISERTIINNLRDTGMVYFIEAIIASKIKNKESELKEFLSEPVSIYYYNALKYLDPKRDIAEIEYLKDNIVL